MKKWAKVLLTAIPATLALSMTALAGEWKLDSIGWWYQNDDGSYYANCWQWIDGNKDGVAECYYFTPEGYLVVDGIADGYTVNSDGAWTENGIVQRKAIVDPSNNSAAMAMYTEAREKHSTLNSIDGNTSYTMIMEMDGVSMEVGVDMDVKMNGIMDGELEYITSGTMEMFGTELPLTAFYKDGWYYADMLNMKVKQPMDYKAALESLKNNSGIAELNLSMVCNMEKKKEGENTVLVYDLDNTVLNSYLEQVASQTGGTASSVVEVNRAVGSLTVDKNGYYIEETMIVDMSILVLMEGADTTVPVRYIIDAETDIYNPGQAVTVTFPSMDGYTDVTAE